MPDRHGESGECDSCADLDDTPPEAVAGGVQRHPLTTAAIIGGAIAATAGAAYLGTRALAGRNRKDGKPLNSVMAAAITACDLSHGSDRPEPSAEEIIVSPAVDRTHS